MLFNSVAFLIFFPLVTILYFLLPFKFRWQLLLFASCFFYMFFKPEYIIILAFTIVIDYYAGILLENARDKKEKKKFLVMSLVANIGVLAIFKYYNFINTNITGLATLFKMDNPIPFLKMALPIGLSFHTFQAMSYTIEVYRGNQKAEKHFGIYALYVMFYPQLVAGPIERPQNVLHQFHEKKFFSYDNAVTGVRLMMWGMFKKVVIADRLAIVTDPAFNHPHDFTATSLFVAAILFSFQIYCDFSGYSDIAIGSARVMGYHLMTNFNRPYNARSITEFWRKWHISLSTWFKDYLYIPLGGNRVSEFKKKRNLMLVFLISGLWHGANWTFIIWGAMHGVFSVIEGVTLNFRNNLAKKLKYDNTFFRSSLQKLITFLLVTVAWVFFRANTAADAFYIIGRFGGIGTELQAFASRHVKLLNFQISGAKLMLCFVVIAVLEAAHLYQRKNNFNDFFKKMPRFARWGLYYAVAITIIIFGIFEKRDFIYFQF